MCVCKSDPKCEAAACCNQREEINNVKILHCNTILAVLL